MIKIKVKGYLHYKSIFCQKVPLDVSLMNFFIWRKNVSFSRYLVFCVFIKSTNFKICDVIIDIAAWWKLHFCLFLLNPTYYQNEIWSNTSVSYKDYGQNFRTIFRTLLSCRHLHHRLPFLVYIMKQKTIIIFWAIFYWFLNIILIYQEKNAY